MSLRWRSPLAQERQQPKMAGIRALAGLVALSLAIAATAQPFPNAPVAGFTLTTNITSLTQSGDFVKVRKGCRGCW